MNKKCLLCENKLKQKTKDFISSRLNVKTGQPIIVKNVIEYYCADDNCDYGFLPPSEEKKINDKISRESRHDLTGEQITKFRESFGFSTKFQAADFLCLNEKTFTRWESSEYQNINRSTELLLRLVARSKDNFDFINHLHKTHFKFVEADYEMLNSSLINLE